MRTLVRSICTGLLGVIAWASSGSGAEIPLLLTNELPFTRIAEPITCGVPLERGFVAGVDQLVLVDERGREPAQQVLLTGSYRDGTPRWVLVTFHADLPAKGQAVYRLVPSRPTAESAGLRYSLHDAIAEIDTGVAKFRIDTARFRLFDSVLLGDAQLVDQQARGGMILKDSSGAVWEDVHTTGAELEDGGPLSVVLAVRGELLSPGKEQRAAFVCRMQFQAGKSEVRVFFTLRNPAAHAHPGNVWDLGSGGSIFLEDFSLRVPLAFAGRTARIGSSADEPPVAAAKIYQDSSGGPNWHSANHVDKDFQIPTSFRGYRIYGTRDTPDATASRTGNGNVGERSHAEADAATRPVASSSWIKEGERADGWLHVRGEMGGVAVAVRDFWQNFPKALSAEGAALHVALWPGEYAGVHELLGGEQKTHEMLFLFHAGAANDQEVEQRLKSFHRPLYAMPEPEAVFATRAFWPTGPIDRTQFGAIEQTCDTFVDPLGTAQASVMTKWDEIDEYGWRHFGDTFADNERSPEPMRRDFPEHHLGRQPISHFGNEYDVNYGVMLQGLRRRDPRWMWLADVMCRHYADICIYHSDAEPAAAYRHGPFTHTTHDTAAFRSTHRMYPSEGAKYGIQYASGGPNAGHCYVASLAQHYYLTGDRNSRDAFLEVAGWTVDSPWFDKRMMGDTRGIGNFLMTHVYAYELTQDPKYYRAALTMVDWVDEPFSGLGGNLFAKAAGRFLDMKWGNGERDADYKKVLDKLLAFGELYLTLPDSVTAQSLEQSCFHAEVLFTCYVHAPEGHPLREQFFAKGKAIMDQVQDLWPGTYRPTKTLIMCFANTGAMFRAVELRARK